MFYRDPPEPFNHHKLTCVAKLMTSRRNLTCCESFFCELKRRPKWISKAWMSTGSQRGKFLSEVVFWFSQHFTKYFLYIKFFFLNILWFFLENQTLSNDLNSLEILFKRICKVRCFYSWEYIHKLSLHSLEITEAIFYHN